MADDADALSQSSLRNGISNAMARIKREFYGKGPSRTRTFICDRIIFSILDDVLTPVEVGPSRSSALPRMSLRARSPRA